MHTDGMIFFRLFPFLAFFLPTLSFGALNLELTQGLRQAIPISMAKFSGETPQLTQIVRKDLVRSGRFKILSAKKEALFSVAGQVRMLPTDKISAQFILTDNTAMKPLLDQTFEVKHSDIRRLAHHISDLIYQKLTGRPGIFSKHIAYVLVQDQKDGQRQFSLMRADADGENPHVLLASSMPIMSPSFSPDGRRIAYVSFEKARAGIYVQDLMTGQRQQVSSQSGINGAPAWSPDGKTLALVLSKADAPKIYLLDLVSRQAKQVTFGASIDTEPSFSPDGKHLVFTSNRSGGPQIYQLSLADKVFKRVTFEGNYNARASYTPDGRYIILLHRDDRGFNIASLELATDQLSLLSRLGRCQSPSVAPNSDVVLYSCQVGQKRGLVMASVDGQVRSRLPTAQVGGAQEPVWSPI